MTSAVLDTNTIVSATLVPVGIPAQILDAARAGHFTVITSAAIIAEVLRVLSYERIRHKYRLHDEDLQRVSHLLRGEAVLVPISREVRGVATHPEDDLILATALSARAQYLVTGDSQLQRLATYEGIRIVSPRMFLGLLYPQGQSTGLILP